MVKSSLKANKKVAKKRAVKAAAKAKNAAPKKAKAKKAAVGKKAKKTAESKTRKVARAAVRKEPKRKASALKAAPISQPTVEKASARPRRRKPIPVVPVAPKPIPQTPVAKLAEIKSQQAAELKKPLPQRPEVMPATHTSSAQQNRTRYSDKELAEFKKIILEKLEQAKKDLQYLQEQIGQKGDGDSGISETTFASSDDGSTSMEREYLVQMASRLRKYIDHLDKALVRIENKTYGICRVTGKLIEKERLLAVPHATLSMEGKRLESHAAQHQEGG